MDEHDELLRTALMEGILEYFEGKTTFQSLLTVGTTAYNESQPNIASVAEVVFQLSSMGDQIAEGKNYSHEYIRETFTSMLEKLVT